jgi:cytochrome oxidase Cu insertion factor (SCO1/SenC/PrrC family)
MVLLRRTFLVLGTVLAVGGLTALAPAAFAKPEIGKPAPDFTAVDTKGQPVALSDLRGKTVVLEWTNDQCPYVQKHYGAGNMQKLQAQAAGEGVVWLTLISSAKDEPGNVTS